MFAAGLKLDDNESDTVILNEDEKIVAKHYSGDIKDAIFIRNDKKIARFSKMQMTKGAFEFIQNNDLLKEEFSESDLTFYDIFPNRSLRTISTNSPISITISSKRKNNDSFGHWIIRSMSVRFVFGEQWLLYRK